MQPQEDCAPLHCFAVAGAAVRYGAMRFNPDLKTKYNALREAGKPAKVAIVALMRTLIETANALVKADRMWTENRACA